MTQVTYNTAIDENHVLALAAVTQLYTNTHSRTANDTKKIITFWPAFSATTVTSVMVMDCHKVTQVKLGLPLTLIEVNGAARTGKT